MVERGERYGPRFGDLKRVSVCEQPHSRSHESPYQGVRCPEQRSPDAEFLEALHSFVIKLALEIIDDARTADCYPTLVKKLVPDDEKLRSQLLDLGTRRNRGKHRGQRAEAGPAAHSGIDTVWHLSSAVTGFYPDPVSPAIREIVDEPGSVFRTPPMFTRSGERPIIRR